MVLTSSIMRPCRGDRVPAFPARGRASRYSSRARRGMRCATRATTRSRLARPWLNTAVHRCFAEQGFTPPLRDSMLYQERQPIPRCEPWCSEPCTELQGPDLAANAMLAIRQVPAVIREAPGYRKRPRKGLGHQQSSVDPRVSKRTRLQTTVKQCTEVRLRRVRATPLCSLYRILL